MRRDDGNAITVSIYVEDLILITTYILLHRTGQSHFGESPDLYFDFIVSI